MGDLIVFSEMLHSIVQSFIKRPRMNMLNHLEKTATFLQAVLEGWIDGILIFSDRQELLYSNRTATELCTQLQSNHSSEPLPREIVRLCQHLTESRELFPNHPVTLESTIVTATSTVRILGQWVDNPEEAHPYLLVRLHDQKTMQHAQAIAEAQRWHLTSREADVWLLRRQGCKREDIAARLYISLNTVKKHLKNIQAKQQAEEEWQMDYAC